MSCCTLLEFRMGLNEDPIFTQVEETQLSLNHTTKNSSISIIFLCEYYEVEGKWTFISVGAKHTCFI